MIRAGDVVWYTGDLRFAPAGFSRDRAVTVARLYDDNSALGLAGVDYFDGTTHSRTSFDAADLTHYPPDLFAATRDYGGRFVVFEGLDGAGKTTLMNLVEKRLFDDAPPAGFRLWRTAEPVSSWFRAQLAPPPTLDGHPLWERPTPTELARLFALDRQHHAVDLVKHLEPGGWVLCDRYYLSTLAYQGAQGVPVALLRDGLANLPRPHLTVFLDTPPDVAGERDTDKPTAVARDRSAEVRDRYRELLRLLPAEEVLTLDGRQDTETLAESVLECLRATAVRPC